MALSGYLPALQAAILDGKFNSTQRTSDAIILDAQVFANQLYKVVDIARRSNLTSKNQHDPESLSVSHLAFVAQHVDIAQATHFVLTKGSDTGKTEGQQNQPSDEVAKDRPVHEVLPLNTLRSLAIQGLNITVIPPATDHPCYGATGNKIDLCAATKQGRTDLFLLSRKSLIRLDSALDDIISDVFGPTNFSGLSTVFPAAHKLQILLILLANKTFQAKPEILAANSLLNQPLLIPR